jgi:1,4-dihydroxy-2-naphthoate polyprenyltransferase
MTIVAPSRAAIWLQAARPKTLPAAVVPVAVGAACASRFVPLAVGPTIAALLGALLLQIGSNLANDVYDHEKGADAPGRVGPTRMVAAGLVTPRTMKRAMLLVFALATLLGIYLTLAAGPWIAVVGALSIVSAISYTAGPFPLGYRGLGELFVFLFFGLVAVTMTAFINMGSIPPLAWISAIPVGNLAAAILVVNNVRDAATDRAVGKRTLVARFGRPVGERIYVLLLLGAYLTPPLAYALGLAPVSALLPLVSLPFAASLARRVRALEGADLNPVLAGTAKLLLLFGLLYCTGLVVSGLPV